MSMLTDKEVRHIAKLARIELNEKEEYEFKKELSSILGFINQLNEVNTDSVEPLYQTTGLVNAMREDKSRDAFPMNASLQEKLIGQAPHKQERFIKVKSVLKKS